MKKSVLALIALIISAGLIVQASYSPACDTKVKKITQSSVRSVKPDLIFQGSDRPQLSRVQQEVLKDYTSRAPEVFQRDSFYRISSYIISEVDLFQNNQRVGKMISISNNLYKAGLITYVLDAQNKWLTITPYEKVTDWVCQSSN